MDQVMHKLRIAHRDATTITVHADFDSAREALQTHAKVTDTYLHALTPRRSAHAQFNLIQLDEKARTPTVAGNATIEPDYERTT